MGLLQSLHLIKNSKKKRCLNNDIVVMSNILEDIRLLLELDTEVDVN